MSGDRRLIQDWLYLQSSDCLYICRHKIAIHVGILLMIVPTMLLAII